MNVLLSISALIFFILFVFGCFSYYASSSPSDDVKSIFLKTVISFIFLSSTIGVFLYFSELSNEVVIEMKTVEKLSPEEVYLSGNTYSIIKSYFCDLEVSKDFFLGTTYSSQKFTIPAKCSDISLDTIQKYRALYRELSEYPLKH